MHKTLVTNILDDYYKTFGGLVIFVVNNDSKILFYFIV